MSFRFIHASDLHLGSPFKGLSEKDGHVAARFAVASREAFRRLIDMAIDERAAFLLIAGDIFDGEWKDNTIGLYFGSELARAGRAGVRVFIAKGNHDADSVVTKSLQLPDNVFLFPSRSAKTEVINDLKVAIHGRSYPNRDVPLDFVTSYPEMRPGWLNIGLLHTSCDGRPGHLPYAPCQPAELAVKGYDYWALGHVHQHEIVQRDPWIVFSGNLQGRNSRETGPKGAVLVEVVEERIAKVKHVALDAARWEHVTVDLSEIDDREAAYRTVRDHVQPLVDAAEDRLMALRVTLVGRSPLYRRFSSDASQVRDEIQNIVNQCREDVWIEKVRLQLEDPTDTAGSVPISTGDLDLRATLSALSADPAFRAEALKIVADVAHKLPGGVNLSEEPGGATVGGVLNEEEFSRLLQDASAAILARVMPDDDAPKEAHRSR